MQRQLLLVQSKQPANPFLSMNNYTLHVISMNDKNKHLTLLSQRKLALTPEIHFLQYKIVGAPKKFKKFCPKTNYKFHQKQIHLVSQSL
jgi:hypothetical protein